jgi:hypothetical protein
MGVLLVLQYMFCRFCRFCLGKSRPASRAYVPYLSWPVLSDLRTAWRSAGGPLTRSLLDHSSSRWEVDLRPPGCLECWPLLICATAMALLQRELAPALQTDWCDPSSQFQRLSARVSGSIGHTASQEAWPALCFARYSALCGISFGFFVPR